MAESKGERVAVLVRIPVHLVEALDKARGDVPRNDAIVEMLGLDLGPVRDMVKDAKLAAAQAKANARALELAEKAARDQATDALVTATLARHAPPKPDKVRIDRVGRGSKVKVIPGKPRAQPEPQGYQMQLGPPPVSPGSRLKKR